VLQWRLEVHPAISFTNALPCALEIELTQPPIILQSFEDSVTLKDSEIAVRELFFLPHDLHLTAHDTNIYSKNHTTPISWEPFKHDKMMISYQIPPGSTWQLPCYLTDRDLYLRVSIVGTHLWSKVYIFSSHLLLQRSIFCKHKAEDLFWSYSRDCDVTLARGPQIKFKRLWKVIREIVFFSDYWIINKTGLAFFYETKPLTIKESTEVEMNSKTLLFTETEYSDSLQNQFMGNLSVPVLLSCPHRRLRIMPYCLIKELDKNNFYLYDLRSSSGIPYNVLTLTLPLNTPHTHTHTGTDTHTDTSLQVYSDETWVFTSLPPSLTSSSSSKNHLYIQTPNKDRYTNPSNENIFSFKVSTNCLVSIAYDARCRQVPSWMRRDGFLSTGERVRTTNSKTVYQLYQKFYRSHDNVRLGGNGTRLASDSRSKDGTVEMYLIFVTECSPKYSEPTIASITIHQSVWKNMIKPIHFSLKPHFKIGDPLYLDNETLSITHLPPILSTIPLLGIQTNYSDQHLSYQRFLELTLQHPSRLFLCIDSNLDIDDYPLWISQTGFKITGLQIGSRERIYNLLCRLCGVERFSIGCLSCHQDSIGNYFLILTDEQDFVNESSSSSSSSATHSMNLLPNLGLINSNQRTAVTSLIPNNGNVAYSLWDNTQENLHLQRPTFDERGRHWSQYFDVAPGNTGELQTTCGSFSVQVSPLPGLFHRTNVVTFFPRFVIVNQLGINVLIRPVSGPVSLTMPLITTNTIELSSNSSGVIYAFTQLLGCESKTERMIIKRWIWVQESSMTTLNSMSPSHPISLDDLGEIYLWLPLQTNSNLKGEDDDSTQSRLLISATVMLQDNIVVVTLKDASSTPPYRLENRSLTHVLEYRQFSSSAWHTLNPGSWKSYVWGNPYGSKHLEIRIANTETISPPLCLDEIGQIPNFFWDSLEVDLTSYLSKALRKTSDLIEDLTGTSGLLGGYIYAKGITRVLILNEVSAKRHSINIFDFLKKSSLSSIQDHDHDSQVVMSSENKSSAGHVDLLFRSLSFSSSLCGIHFNLFQDEQDHSIQEILSINIEGFIINYSGHNPDAGAEISIYHIQIDDMRRSPRFPVIFVPSNSGYNSHLSDSLSGSGSDDGLHLPFIHMRCRWKYGFLSTDILHLSEFQFIIQPINLKVDVELLMSLARLIGKMIQETNHHSSWMQITSEAASIQAAVDTLSQTLNPHILQTYLISSKRPIYIELFHYGSLVIYAEVLYGFGSHLPSLTQSNLNLSIVLCWQEVFEI
jgi:hypothetical protein